MDTRTGAIYPDREAAIAAGVPDDFAVPVNITGETLTVANGPFKGRIYEVANGRRGRRRKDLEAKRDAADRLQRQLASAK